MNYDKLPYPPFNKKTIERLNEFSEFKNFRHKEKENLIYYLILVYDRNSDLFLIHSDNLYLRKKEAAIKVGFKLDKEKHFEADIEAVLVGENEHFNLCVFRYVRMSGVPDLPVLIKYIEMLDHEMAAPLPDKPKERADVRNNIDVLLKKVEELEIKIFTGRESEAARESLYRLIERIRVPRPENIADDIENKTLDLPKVHGEN